MTIIRTRRPRTDNNEIFRLIRTELIPLSHTVREDDPQTLRELPKRLRLGITLVAARKKSGPPLGFVHLIANNQTLLIDMLVVHPQQQGKRLGQLLMQRGEQYGLSKKCTEAHLFVDEGNGRAHNFYTRLGYHTLRYYPEFRCYEMFKSFI